MNRTTRALAASAALAVLAAGCASSGHTTASHAAASSSTSAANAYGGSYGGGYGSTSSSTSSSSAALITTKSSSRYGTILAYGPRHLTVYVFSKDSGHTSSCTGQCAKFWPPVTGTPKAQGAVASANLATIARPGGGKQVTYKGHPLYLFASDHSATDVAGQGLTAFGGKWYAVRPSGAPA